MVIKSYPVDDEPDGVQALFLPESSAAPDVGEIVDIGGRFYIVKRRTWEVKDGNGVWALFCRIGLKRLGDSE